MICFLKSGFKDAHGLKIQGGKVCNVFPKILGTGFMILGKNFKKEPNLWVLLHFYFQVFLKIFPTYFQPPNLNPVYNNEHFTIEKKPK